MHAAIQRRVLSFVESGEVAATALPVSKYFCTCIIRGALPVSKYFYTIIICTFSVFVLFVPASKHFCTIKQVLLYLQEEVSPDRGHPRELPLLLPLPREVGK